MSPPPGNIAHYRLTTKLGEGGMGAVYQATDTKLNREVAVKILPDTFAADPDRLARFTREAQVLASLNHPNIAAIYGVEDRALILELVPGETLRGTLPLDTALPIIRQLIDALEYAHEKGVVHRDLKPANLKITPDGRLKVLDFGLAKALSGDAATSDSMSSPTLTMRATLAGAIMGTPGYMSPEQARGHAVDKRADIWAFGAVVFEMLTGEQLFAGHTVSDSLAAVLTKEADVTRLPPVLRPLVRQCLVKDARLRLRDIGDARLALDAPAPEAPPTPPTTRAAWLPWTIAALACSVLAATFALRPAAPAAAPTFDTAEDSPEPVVVQGAFGPSLTLSPDGSRIVYVTRSAAGAFHLLTRKLDQQTAVPLTGTEGAYAPFFSPDGRWIGYLTQEGVFKISTDGGAPVLVNAAGSAVRGAVWTDDATIVLGMAAAGLQRVPAKGGDIASIVKREPGEGGYRWPARSPDGLHIVYAVQRMDSPGGPSLMAYSLQDGQRKTIIEDGEFPRFLPSGELAFLRTGTLYVVTLDRQLQPVGEPRPILRDVAAIGDTGGSQLALSATGGVAYIPGWIDTDRVNLTWLHADGSQQVLGVTAKALAPRLSPDGKKVVYGVGHAITRSANDFYVRDLERGTTSRVTNDNLYKRAAALWTPDGRYLLYCMSGSRQGIFQVPADGSAPPRKLLDLDATPEVFSLDGKSVLLSVFEGGLFSAPVTLSAEGVQLGTPTVWMPGAHSFPRLSADGKWLAYIDSQAGSHQIFVSPFLGARSRYPVASGESVVWSRTGLILYIGGVPPMLLKTVKCAAQGETFHCDSPQDWSNAEINYRGGTGSFDVAADGSVLALTRADRAKPAARIHFVFNLNTRPGRGEP